MRTYLWLAVAAVLLAVGGYFGVLYQERQDAQTIKDLREALLREERADIKTADAGNKQVAESIDKVADAKEKSVEVRTEYVTKIVFKDRQCPAMIPATAEAINKLLEASNATDLFVTSSTAWWLRHYGPGTFATR